MKAVILAAGVGSRLAPLTDDRPKALVDVAGRSFLLRQLDLLAAAGIPSRDVVVVGGYRIEMIQLELGRGGYDCTLIRNDKYEQWNNFHSLAIAEPAVRGHDILQLDGDTILDRKLLPRVIAAPGAAVLAVDRRGDLDGEMMKVELYERSDRVARISKQLDPGECVGEFMGVTKLTEAAASAVFLELATFPDEQLTHEYYEFAYDRLIRRDKVRFELVDVHDCGVIEIDDRADLARAEAILKNREIGGRA